jgi:protein-disulfide isomerase
MDFVGLARELGLDTASFGQCVTSGQYEDDVEEDFQGGIALGVQSTPTVFVNGLKLVGAQPLADFREIIESELQKQ